MRSTGLLESAITTNRSAAAATIFSRVWAPPPPLTSQPSGATWSAPSIAISSRSRSANGSTAIPSSRAARSVRGEVATQRISSRRAASAGSRWATVEPVPSPTRIPSSTSSAAASAARCFSASISALTIQAIYAAMEEIDRLAINTIRTLSIDAIQKANSGHPGTPMALAPVAYSLWQRFLRFDPEEPIWPNRDRFVLSAGHASMLLYSLLYLTGVRAVDPDYEVARPPVGDPRRHQVVSPARLEGRRATRSTAGPPGSRRPPARSARASRPRSGWRSPASGRRRYFNRPGFELFDYDVYVICGDGDLMEGVSHEAASLAGHQRLDNLCWIYDNNHITIDGRTELTYEDDVAARFMGYGWHVMRVGDANDLELLDRAFARFRQNDDRPTLIIVDSHIGYGSPHKQDTAAAHGEPLGEEEVRETKRAYGWPEDAEFLVPDGVVEHFARRDRRARATAAGGVGEPARRLPARARLARAPDRPDAAPRAARGLGSRHPLVRARREGRWRPARPRTRSQNAIAEQVPW